MSTLHERLLAELDHARRARGRDEMVAALRAVLELHGPFVSPSQPGRAPDFCRHCSTAEGWPCSTIQAIARELGVEELDRRSE